MNRILLLSLLSLWMLLFPAPLFSQKRMLVKGGEWLFNGKQISTQSFRIAKYEITNAQYARFLNNKMIGIDGIYKGRQLINTHSDDLQLEFTGNKWLAKPGREDYPMVMVSYYGAVEFCKWAKGMLPDYEQWTYAARGGRKSKNYTYAGSNHLDEVGWFKENCEGHAHEVGKKQPNELGIYDMSGNAWEWCRNDSLKAETDFCLHMGGSWFPGEQPSRISAYYGNTPTHFSNSVGFRVIFPVAKRQTHKET